MYCSRARERSYQATLTSVNVPFSPRVFSIPSEKLFLVLSQAVLAQSSRKKFGQDEVQAGAVFGLGIGFGFSTVLPSALTWSEGGVRSAECHHRV